MGKKFKLIMFWITVLDSESFLHLPSLLPDKTWDQAIIRGIFNDCRVPVVNNSKFRAKKL